MRLLAPAAAVLALLAGPAAAVAGTTPGTGASAPASTAATAATPAAAPAPPPPVVVVPADAHAGDPVTLRVTVGGAPVTTPVRWTLAQPGQTRRLRSPGGELTLPGLPAGGTLVSAAIGAAVANAGFTVAPAPAPIPAPAPARPRPARVRADATPRAVAHAASAVSVGIRDFAFGPTTVTVSVGDTVTWTNNGKQPHTATASDGSFDTGLLKTGQSGSHTFTKAGTFAYICTVHPFMKGTVVVRAAASPKAPAASSTPAPAPPSASGGGAPGSTATVVAPAATAAPAAPSLPNTGDHPLWRLALGATLLGLGFAARRLLRSGYR